MTGRSPWRYVGRDRDGRERIAGTVIGPIGKGHAVSFARELLGRWGDLDRVDLHAPRGALIESVRRPTPPRCRACGVGAMILAGLCSRCFDPCAECGVTHDTVECVGRGGEPIGRGSRPLTPQEGA